MRILELRTSNIKNLKVVEIRPGDGAVILTGRNGAGKSAVLDSIFCALTGKKLERPIRDGEQRAEVEVDLGDYRVKKVFTAKGERLEVISKDGALYKSPQAMLNGILGDLTFDPLKFSTMEEKPRRDLLASLVGLDFAHLDRRRNVLYEERTIRHRNLKGASPISASRNGEAPVPLDRLVFGMEPPLEGTPRVEISLSEEFAKVEALEAKVRVHQGWQREQDEHFEFAEKCRCDIDGKQDEIAQLEERIKTLRHDIEILGQNRTSALESGKELLEPEDVTPEQIIAARNAVKEVEVKNVAIRKAIEYDRKAADASRIKEEVDGIENEIVGIDTVKQEAIKAAKFPIEGLGLTDEYVVYNGRPFGQLSTGEQIRISTAVAMALNPTLKIILVREGSLLDKAGLKAIIDMAVDKDYQLFIEKVSDDKGVGIFIEDGTIVSIDGKETNSALPQVE